MPAWQRCHSSPVLIHGAASAGGRPEKVTFLGGNEPTTELCFIWEEHLEGSQELQINSIYSLLRWSKAKLGVLSAFSFTMNRGASRGEIPWDLN